MGTQDQNDGQWIQIYKYKQINKHTLDKYTSQIIRVGLTKARPNYYYYCDASTLLVRSTASLCQFIYCEHSDSLVRSTASPLYLFTSCEAKEKWNQSYGLTLNWLHCTILFSLLSAIQCIHGARSSRGNPMKELHPVDLVTSKS